MSELPEKREKTGIVLTVIHSILLAGYAAFFASFLIEYIPNPQAIGVVAFLLVYLVYGSPAPVVFGIVEIIRAATHRIHRKAEWITYLAFLVFYIAIVVTLIILGQNGSSSAA